jgi:hypothetical protein
VSNTSRCTAIKFVLELVEAETFPCTKIHFVLRVTKRILGEKVIAFISASASSTKQK